ncbi:MAG: DUF983 domain-containing protein [Flavobacteriaceae bacterium]|nr:DUF983 domain-containing protein [Flavobacteriaceae bacterium]
MFKKGAKLYSIFNNKCPKCQEGDFFVNKTPFKFKNNLKIHEKCPNCDLKYMLEPSFFYGAMYVSYGLTIAFSIAIFIIGYWLNLNLITSFIAIVVILILMTPITMRLSRLIYINMFITYTKEVRSKE